MSTSRRKFLRTGLLATLFATIPLKSILGQSWKDRDGNPGETPVTQSDVLGNYSKATFLSYLNSIFQLQTSFGIVTVTLASVDDMPAPKGGECFTLLFRGGSRALSQNTYTISHASLGTFALLLVPGGADQNGAQSYVATLNRISQADLANMSPPTRNTTPRTSAPSTPASTPSTPISPASPVITPNTIPVGPTIVPATPVKKPRRKHRVRKPSWKNDDVQRFNLDR
jgi:hypothetical protein